MLRISVQPKYVCQYWLRSGKICAEDKGQSVKVTMALPKIQYVPATDYYILCTLHVYNDDDISSPSNTKSLPLSGYWVQKRSDIISDEDVNECNEVKWSHTNIFEVMKLQKSLNNKNLVFTYELDGYIILDAIEEEREISLSERTSLLEKLNVDLPERRCNSEGKGQEKSVLCLGFTAFEKHQSTDKFTRITQTIYSNSFAINHNLNLDYMVPERGNVEGGQEVVLFLNSNKSYKRANVKVFVNDSETDRSLDIADIEILQKNEKRSRNVFINNKAIIFTMPPLPKELRNRSRDQTMVFIKVYLPSTKETSNFLTFDYYQQRNVTDEPSSTSKESCGNTITIYDAAKPSVKLVIATPTSDWIIVNDKYANDFHQNFSDIFKSCVHIVPQFPGCGSLRMEVDNGFKKDVPVNVTILSETIESRFGDKNKTIAQPMMTCTAKSAVDKKRKSDSAINIPDALDVATDFFIKYKDDIKGQESKKRLFPAPARAIDYLSYYLLRFRPILEARCSMVEKDVCENTVLHSAINLKHSKCLGQFMEMFTNSTEYPTSYQEELKNLFSVYDSNGHTVLHTAVLNNMEDLVRVMLDFCQKNQINVEDCRISGSGDSIQHLAVQSGLPNIAAMVLRYTPRVRYSGDGQQDGETDMTTDGK